MNAAPATTMLLTGATSGIGRAMALALARPGTRLILASRDQAAGSTLADELARRPGVSAEFRTVDLSNLASVRRLAEGVLRDVPRLEVLLNNAGCQSRTLRRTEEGHERVFATNVLGPFLLTAMLLPKLEASAPARIVNTASTFAGGLDLDDVDFQRRWYSPARSYRQTKQANRMWTRALARRLRGKHVTANAFAPGMVMTNIYGDLSWISRVALPVVSRLLRRTPEQGADTGVWLATSPDVAGVTGRFFERRREKRCQFTDEAQEEKLWALCERLCGLRA